METFLSKPASLRSGRILPDLTAYNPDDRNIPDAEIAIYDPGAIRAALTVSDERSFVGPDEEQPGPPEPHSSEEVPWRKTLLRIANDHRGPFRPILIGNQQMREEITQLRATAPHYSVLLDLVERAVAASQATRTRIRFPPILLVGAPGIGKSYVTGRLARALAVHTVSISMNLTNERGKLGGYSQSWRGARIGELATAVLSAKSRKSSVLFHIDELDKSDPHERLHDVLLSAMEQENARAFVDEYLTGIAPLRLDHCLWLCTANETADIPAPVLDRLLVLKIQEPSAEQKTAVLKNIFRDAAASYGPRFLDKMSEDVAQIVLRFTPRTQKRILELAIPVAIARGGWELGCVDVEQAIGLLEAPPSPRAGFL